MTTASKNIRTSVVMVVIGIGFGFVFLATKGASAFAQYQTAYVMEKMLSVDNLAVMATIFAAFNADQAMQKKALNYGIAGAIVMRLGLILLGAEALERFEFMSMVFGGLLGYSAWKMISGGSHDEQHEPAVATRIRKVFPRMSTLMIVIVAVEATDLLFAVDSVPAVLSVTDDRVIAFTSNVAAILGLRALFFVLRDGMNRIVYLNQTLAIVLAYVGVKMATHHWIHIHEAINIAIVFGIFGAGLALSMKKTSVSREVERSDRPQTATAESLQ